MPSQSTGSDTRMYNPRSESSYHEGDTSSDRYGGNADAKERLKEKEKDEREQAKSKDAPHIRIKPKRKPKIREEDEFRSQPIRSEMAQTTMPAGSAGTMLDTAVGAKTGTGSALGDTMANMVFRSEDEPWFGLLKDNAFARRIRREGQQQWKNVPFKRPPGGRFPERATRLRAAGKSRALGGLKGTRRTGLDRAHLALERSHLGVKTKQPLRMFPQDYQRSKARMEMRRLFGETPFPKGTHLPRAERPSKVGVSPGRRMGRPQPTHVPGVRRTPSMSLSSSMGHSPSITGSPIYRSEDKIEKKMFVPSYAELAQLRQIVTELRREVKKLSSGFKKSGDKAQESHSGNSERKKTTRPQGPTDDNPEDDPRTWGMSPKDIVATH